MIPGIFNPSTVVYCASDFEKEATFTQLLQDAAKKLHIPKHQIIDKDGNPYDIWCSVPTKVNREKNRF